MKIGYFTDTYYPQLNGVTIAVDQFAQELRRQGHTVYIFAPKIKGYKDTRNDIFRISSVKILSSEPEVMFPLMLPEASIRKIFSLDIDIIHAHGNGAFSFLGYQVAKTKHIPFIMTFHNLHTKYTHYVFNGRIIKPGMVATGLRLFGNLCDCVIVPSEKMRREVLKFGVKKTIRIIPNFIDVQRFAKQEKGYLHSLLQLPQEVPLLLSVGRLGREKNFAFLIRMFAKLAKKEKQSHLVIVGKGTDELLLKHLAKQLNITHRVHFTGAISSHDMPKVYSDATLFLFSSTSETQGLCVLEAAAAGLPLVVAKDLAYQEIVLENKNGYLLQLNQKVFVKKINQLLKNPELLHDLSKQSVLAAKAYSQPQKITQQLIEIYASTIQTFSEGANLSLRTQRLYLYNFLRITQRLQKLFTT